MADSPSDSHNHHHHHHQRYPGPSLSTTTASSTNTNTTTTRTKRPFHQTTSSPDMSSSASATERQVESGGSARKRARNSLDGPSTTNTSTRRDSVDDDRRSFVTAYESSPERSSSARMNTSSSTVSSSAPLTGDRERRIVPPAPAPAPTPSSSSASQPPANSSTTVTSTRAAESTSSRQRSSSFPLREDEEDDRMDTDSPDSEALAEAARPSAVALSTSNAHRPLFHELTPEPEMPSSASSTTAEPSSEAHRPAPPSRLSRSSHQPQSITPAPPSSSSWTVSSEPQSIPSSRPATQPRPVSQTFHYYQQEQPTPPPPPYEFRSASSARRFSDTIDPLRRSPASPRYAPSSPRGTSSNWGAEVRPPSPPSAAYAPSSPTQGWRGEHDGLYANMVAAHRALEATRTLVNASTGGGGDGPATTRLPPVIGAFPLEESSEDSEESSEEEYDLPEPVRRTRGMVVRVESTPNLASTGAERPTRTITPPSFDFNMRQISHHQHHHQRHHHADDEIALEPDLTPPIFAGPDDHVHNDDGHPEVETAAPPPSADPALPPSSGQLRLESLARLAEDLNGLMAQHRRTLQTAQMELSTSASSPPPDPRVRAAYENMVRALTDAGRRVVEVRAELERARVQLENAMTSAGAARSNAQSGSVTVRSVATRGASRSRPVSMYEGGSRTGADVMRSWMRQFEAEDRVRLSELNALEESARNVAAGRTTGSSSVGGGGGGGGESVAASATATGYAGLASRPGVRLRRTVQPSPQQQQSRSASSAPASSSAASGVVVEGGSSEPPSSASSVRERVAEGWSPLQISAFVPPPQPPRPLPRRPGSRYSSVDHSWHLEDPVGAMDEFNVGDYEYYRNMAWNRRQRPEQRDVDSAPDSASMRVRTRLLQQAGLPPSHPYLPHLSPAPTTAAAPPPPNDWPYSEYEPLDPAHLAIIDPLTNVPPPPAPPRATRQNSEIEAYVVSPNAWDYATAAYTRSEVSPLTPTYTLPPAPRMMPRNLSMSGMQIHTGYTPAPSRNNSLVPPSPHGGLSPGLMGLPGHRSLLMGDRSPLSRTVEEPESYVPSPVSPGAMGGAPWRGWTQDNIGRSDGPPRPSIAITRSSSSSTSNPTTLERELLVTPDTDAPWLTGRLTTEPETAGYGNSLHVPLGFSRPQSVVEDIRRRRLAAATRSRSGMAAATSPSSPQTPTPALSSGPETAMQRASRFANQSWLRPSVSPRVRRPVSISEETPHTPPISGTSTQPPGAPLDADSAATSFVRTAAERAGSPSPTRLSRSAEDRLLRIRAIRTEAARQSAAHSLSRPSMESLTSGSSSRRSGSLWRDILRPESRRSSAFDFMDFQDDTPDFPTFMETIIGGGLSALSPPPPGGLTSEEIAALPSSAYKDSEEAKKEERCPICLDDYEETSEVMGVPDCNHFFHKACLSQWLDRNRSCPYCRKNIPRRNNRRGTGSISGRHRHRPGPPPPPPPGPWSSGSSWRSSGSSGGPDASWGAGWA